MNLQTMLDRTYWQLLEILQHDARLTLRQIGERIGLTAPAVAERIKRLEETGVVLGYTAEVDVEKLGLGIRAFIHLTGNSEQCFQFRAAVPHFPQILECHTVTGHESFILKVAVPSVAALENLLLALKDYGDVRTSLILSTQVRRQAISPRTLEMAVASD